MSEKPRRRRLKWLLFWIVLLTVAGLEVWDHMLNTVLRQRLAPLQKHLVDPVTWEDIDVNVLTGRVVIRGLTVPQPRQPGSPEAVLSGQSLLTCEEIDLNLDLVRMWEESFVHVSRMTVSNLEVGMVLDEKLQVVPALLLPGALLGEIPPGYPHAGTRVDYCIDQLEVTGCCLAVTPKEAQSENVTFDNLKITGTHLSNINQMTSPLSELNVSLACGEGAMELHVEAITFDKFLEQGTGHMSLRIKDLPLKKLAPFFRQSRAGFEFVQGHLDGTLQIEVADAHLKATQNSVVLKNTQVVPAPETSLEFQIQIMGFNVSGGHLEKNLPLEGKLRDFRLGHLRITF